MRSNDLGPVSAALICVLAGCPADPDCAPEDDAAWQEVALHPDRDGDGYGAVDTELRCIGDSVPIGWLESVDVPDCDDGSAAIFPGAPDLPGDGIDQDCDGLDRELVRAATVYVDGGDPDCQELEPGTVDAPNCSMTGAAPLLDPGGTMRVAGGTYVRQLVLAGRTYIGGHDPTDWSLDREGRPTVVQEPDNEPGDDIQSAGALLFYEEGTNLLTTVEGFDLRGDEGSRVSVTLSLHAGEFLLRELDIQAAGADVISWGILVRDSARVTIEDTNIRVGSGATMCAVVEADSSVVELVRTTLRGCGEARQAVGLEAKADSVVTLRDSVLEVGSDSTEVHGIRVSDGAGLFLSASVIRALGGTEQSAGLSVDGRESRIEVLNSAFLGASEGAASSRAAVVGGEATLLAANSLFSGGTSEAADAAGVEVGLGEAVLVNCLVDGGESKGGLASALRVQGSSTLRLVANDLWGPVQDAALISANGQYGDAASVNGCDWPGCVEASANMVRDPEFEQPGGRSFRLRADSPCVDAGVDPSPYGLIVDRDIEGLPAPSDGNGDDNPVWDVGPHER